MKKQILILILFLSSSLGYAQFNENEAMTFESPFIERAHFVALPKAHLFYSVSTNKDSLVFVFKKKTKTITKKMPTNGNLAYYLSHYRKGDKLNILYQNSELQYVSYILDVNTFDIVEGKQSSNSYSTGYQTLFLNQLMFRVKSKVIKKGKGDLVDFKPDEIKKYTITKSNLDLDDTSNITNVFEREGEIIDAMDAKVYGDELVFFVSYKNPNTFEQTNYSYFHFDEEGTLLKKHEVEPTKGYRLIELSYYKDSKGGQFYTLSLDNLASEDSDKKDKFVIINSHSQVTKSFYLDEILDFDEMGIEFSLLNTQLVNITSKGKNLFFSFFVDQIITKDVKNVDFIRVMEISKKLEKPTFYSMNCSSESLATQLYISLGLVECFLVVSKKKKTLYIQHEFFVVCSSYDVKTEETTHEEFGVNNAEEGFLISYKNKDDFKGNYLYYHLPSKKKKLWVMSFEMENSKTSIYERKLK